MQVQILFVAVSAFLMDPVFVIAGQSQDADLRGNRLSIFRNTRIGPVGIQHRAYEPKSYSIYTGHLSVTPGWNFTHELL